MHLAVIHSHLSGGFHGLCWAEVCFGWRHLAMLWSSPLYRSCTEMSFMHNNWHWGGRTKHVMAGFGLERFSCKCLYILQNRYSSALLRWQNPFPCSSATENRPNKEQRSTYSSRGSRGGTFFFTNCVWVKNKTEIQSSTYFPPFLSLTPIKTKQQKKPPNNTETKNQNPSTCFTHSQETDVIFSYILTLVGFDLSSIMQL